MCILAVWQRADDTRITPELKRRGGERGREGGVVHRCRPAIHPCLLSTARAWHCKGGHFVPPVDCVIIIATVGPFFGGCVRDEPVSTQEQDVTMNDITCTRQFKLLPRAAKCTEQAHLLFVTRTRVVFGRYDETK